MPTYPVKIPQLGIEQLPMTGDTPPSNKDVWDAVKLKVDPMDMFRAWDRGEKEFVRDAYRNDYFAGAGIGEGLKHVGGLFKEGGEGIVESYRAASEGASLRRKYDAVRLDPASMKKGHKLFDHDKGLQNAGMYLHGLLMADIKPEVAIDQSIKAYGMDWYGDQNEVKKWISLYQGL